MRMDLQQKIEDLQEVIFCRHGFVPFMSRIPTEVSSSSLLHVGADSPQRVEQVIL